MTESKLKSLRLTLTDRLSDLLGPPPEDEQTYRQAAIYDVKALAAKHGLEASEIGAHYYQTDSQVVGVEVDFKIAGKDISVSVRPPGSSFGSEKTEVASS